MRILHIIFSVSPETGGPIDGIIRQNEALMPMGVEHEILSLDSPDQAWVANCPVKTYATGIRSAFWRSLKRYIPWLRYGYSPHFVPWLKENAGKYDVIVVNGLWNYTALGTWLALKRSSVPYVVFAHGMLDPWFRKTYPLKHLAKQIFWLFSEGNLLNNAAAVFFTTEDEKLLARNAFWPYRVNEQVVGYGSGDIHGDSQAQIAAFRNSLPALSGRRFILFLGRIHPKKGCDLLIRAFAKIARQRSDFDLVIAGPDQTGWRKELEQIAKSEGVAQRIHWPGMLSGDTKWGAYHACDAFILTSHQENFGVVVAEAMACAKPVFITDKVNIWREVERCGAGFVAADTQEGADQLIERFCSLSGADRKMMGQAARAGFLEHFEMSATAKNILNAMKQLKNASSS